MIYFLRPVDEVLLADGVGRGGHLVLQRVPVRVPLLALALVELQHQLLVQHYDFKRS